MMEPLETHNDVVLEPATLKGAFRGTKAGDKVRSWAVDRLVVDMKKGWLT